MLLDVGANVDTKPEHLRQFAVMGHFYAQEVLGIAAPRIGLMSIGEEEGKGTDLTREVFRVLKTTGLNFVGNVEGRDVFNGAVDVVVCDGFVGNVVLKSAEALAELIGRMLREEMARHAHRGIGLRAGQAGVRRLPPAHRLHASTARAPLLGVNGGCFIGHGRSNARAIQNADPPGGRVLDRRPRTTRSATRSPSCTARRSASCSGRLRARRTG